MSYNFTHLVFQRTCLVQQVAFAKTVAHLAPNLSFTRSTTMQARDQNLCVGK